MIRKLAGALLLLSFAMVGAIQAADYVVQPGDTLSQIALDLKVPMGRLVLLNGVKNPDYIQAGQALKYLSRQDIRDAIEFCRNPFPGSSMGAGGALVMQWRAELEIAGRDLEAGKIQYFQDEPGVAAKDVLEMAKSFRLMLSDHFFPSLPHTFPEGLKKIFGLKSSVHPGRRSVTFTLPKGYKPSSSGKYPVTVITYDGQRITLE